MASHLPSGADWRGTVLEFFSRRVCNSVCAAFLVSRTMAVAPRVDRRDDLRGSLPLVAFILGTVCSAPRRLWRDVVGRGPLRRGANVAPVREARASQMPRVRDVYSTKPDRRARPVPVSLVSRDTERFDRLPECFALHGWPCLAVSFRTERNDVYGHRNWSPRRFCDDRLCIWGLSSRPNRRRSSLSSTVTARRRGLYPPGPWRAVSTALKSSQGCISPRCTRQPSAHAAISRSKCFRCIALAPPPPTPELLSRTVAFLPCRPSYVRADRISTTMKRKVFPSGVFASRPRDGGNKKGGELIPALLFLLTADNGRLTASQYIPPPMPPGGGPACLSSLSGISLTSASVVSRSEAMEAAFWSAVRVTLVGSITPASTRSSYDSV